MVGDLFGAPSIRATNVARSVVPMGLIEVSHIVCVYLSLGPVA